MQGKATHVTLDSIKARLQRDMTITAPTWVYVALGVAVLVILGVALD